MGKSKIDYLDWVINYVTGCTQISDGCKNCYAKGMYERFDKSGLPFSNVRIDKDRIVNECLTLHKKHKQLIVGVNFMADTFHKEVGVQHLRKLLGLAEQLSQHQFIIFTKRYDKLNWFIDRHNDMIPNNVHFGVSICNRKDLLSFHREVVNSVVKRKLVISFEPLLEKLGVDTNYPLTHTIREHCKWAIVGAESGYNKRTYNEEWAIQIRDLCKNYNVPFYHKQQFVKGKKTQLLAGKEYLQTIF